MRHTWILGLLLALFIRTPAGAQFDSGNFEHNVIPGLLLPLPLMASDHFSPLHSDIMRLRGPVAEARLAISQKNRNDAPDADWRVSEGGELLYQFDEHGCATTVQSGESFRSELKTTYRTINGKQAPAGITGKTRAEAAEPTEHTAIYTYDDTGRLVLVSTADKGAASGCAFEYTDDGLPRQVILTKRLEGESDVWIYNTDGRLIEMTTIPETPRRMTITWLSSTQFELHQGPASQPVLMGQGTLDEHGSLLLWSFRPPLRGPNLIGFRNEITYDERGNWTRIISYTEAEPGEENPSRPIVKYERTITYR